MIYVSKRIVAAAVAAVAVVAVSVQATSSWAEALPEGSGVYCYANSLDKSNPTRGHVTDIVTTGDQMTVVQTWEKWDRGQGRYIAEDSVAWQATVDPKWAREMTHICQIFLGDSYRYATAG